ncbi:hypothetical protein JTB14_005883 [Gonioctena quinquepunctata]|nr:hypothetical protein JTB14_005883 [Gonioctena quinquepunctata]
MKKQLNMGDESDAAGMRPPKPLTFTENMLASWKGWIHQFNWYAKNHQKHNFLKVVQQEDGPFDEFLGTIETQAKTCEFGNLTDSLLKDEMVFGVQSDVVRDKLLTDENLNLNKSISICRASEQATKQLEEINVLENTPSERKKIVAKILPCANDVAQDTRKKFSSISKQI